MIIPCRNLLHIDAPKTYLTNTEVAGTTVFRIRNTNGLAASWAVQIGETGEEQTEVLILASGAITAGTLGTVTASSRYEHPADTPVYGIKYDQVVFERSTAGTAGTAIPMTNGTVTYQPDSLYTIFDDTSGSASYAYKTYFRASVLAVNTIESDWITSAGFNFYALGALRQRVKDRMWDATFIKSDSVIDDWINEWKDELTNAAIQVNDDYAIGTVDVAFGTAGLGTITSADFKQVRRFWVTTDSTNYYQSRKMSSNDFGPQDVFIATQPKHNWEGDTVFHVHNGDTAGTARLEYYKLNTRLVNDTDELPVPMRAYTSSFVSYAEAQAQAKDQKLDAYDRKIEIANQAKKQFIAEITPRDKSGATYVKQVEPISGDSTWWY